VKQAVCRWEMDSDWERQQKALGIIPVEALAGPTSSVESRKWPKWLKMSSSSKEGNRVAWMEKAR
jgi:hypothetical protein